MLDNNSNCGLDTATCVRNRTHFYVVSLTCSLRQHRWFLLSYWRKTRVPCIGYMFVADSVQGGTKIGTVFVRLTSSNINRFSKLFYSQNQEKICRPTNTVTKDPTALQVSWMSSVLEATTENKTISETIHFKKLTTEKTCSLSQSLSKVTVTFCSF